MTVVVGFVGSDGAVMVPDSQASETDQTKYNAPKLWQHGNLLFGYSGNTAVRDVLQLAIAKRLNDKPPGRNRWTVRAELCAAGKPVLTGEYQNYVPAPPQGQIPASLAGSLLVLGRDDDGYWLLDIDHNNVGTFHPERGFHAIGSGSNAAQVARGLLEHYEPGDRTVEHLRLIAFRTVDTCIRVLDAGVGGPVQLWSSTEEEGAFEQAREEDVRDVQHGVDQWALIERESLSQILGEAKVDESAAADAGIPESLEEEPGQAGA